MIHALRTNAATGVTATNGSTGVTANSWTNNTNAQGTTDNNVYATAAPAKNGSTVGDWTNFGFDSSLPTDMTITKVEIIPQYSVSTNTSVASLQVTPIVSGAACGAASTDSSEPTVDTEYIADVTTCRTWTRTNVLNANFRVRITGARGNSNTAVTFNLDYIKVRVTYNTPTFDQSAYRWYEPADSTTPGTPWAATNTAATLYAPSDRVRLRVLLHLTNVNLSASGEQFKLQYGQKSGTCAAATYADVTTSTTIAYYNNTTPADNTTISTTVNDPTHSGHTIIAQKYAENSPISTPNAITTGQDGIWDISLTGNGAPANTTYCFRMAKNSGTALDTYTVYPELTTAPSATLDSDFVDASSATVASPTFALSNLASTSSCQTSTGTIGTAAQKIRVRNTTTTPGWSLSIAATSGNTALWSAGTPKYDYNDGSGSPAGCGAGLDADTHAGRMTLDANAGTLSSRSICTTTGVTKGASASFNEGVVDAITLLTASAGAQTGCYWELVSVGVSQTVPATQEPGSYSINLTMTVVAN